MKVICKRCLRREAIKGSQHCAGCLASIAIDKAAEKDLKKK